MKKITELEKKLAEKGLSQTKIDKVINHCEKLVRELERLSLQTEIEIPPKK